MVGWQARGTMSSQSCFLKGVPSFVHPLSVPLSYRGGAAADLKQRQGKLPAPGTLTHLSWDLCFRNVCNSL